ncbi:MAG: right-handed parallel beta-helix repeat-containing protein [Anaerolineales bacterium]
MNAKIRLLAFLFSTFLAACEFTPFAPLPPDLPGLGERLPRLVPIDLYAATTGNDDNPCTSPTQPCRTLQAAADKAEDGDTIHMAAGTYGSPDESLVSYAEILKSVTIVGAGRDATFLNVRNFQGILIVGVDGVSIRDLTIRNSTTERRNTGIWFDPDSGEGTVENVRVVNFPARGIRHQGTARLILTNVLIEGSNFGGASGVEAQNCVIQGSQIRGNNNAGVLCSTLVMENSVVENNGWFGLIPYPDLPTRFISIQDSRFENNGNVGIFSNGGSTALNRVTITANGLGELGLSHSFYQGIYLLRMVPAGKSTIALLMATFGEFTYLREVGLSWRAPLKFRKTVWRRLLPTHLEKAPSSL